MSGFIKNLSRFLGGTSKSEPALYLSAFGKHPGWNDHLDDQGLDTDALITAKRLLYVQGISQNIDGGTWEKLDPEDPAAAGGALTRLELFRHNILWHMPGADGLALLAGRLWSSTDGKGRAKYPMVLCAQLTEVPDEFAGKVVFPFLAQVQEQCVAATTAEGVRQIIGAQREVLRGRMGEAGPARLLTGKELAEVARHADMCAADPGSYSHGGAGGGFHRIVYQFVKGMSHYRLGGASGSRGATVRPEQVRVPGCGMTAAEALVFWRRFALTLLDGGASILLLTPDQPGTGWVDLIVGEPSPGNLFCIKAGPRNLPLTSDIPYTLDPGLVRAIDGYVAQCAELPEGAAMPAWPAF